MKKRILQTVVMIALIGLLVLNFSNNFLGDKKEDIEGHTFETFQSDSEYLVFSEIFQDKYGLEEKHYGLAEVVNEEGIRIENIWDLIKDYDNQQQEIKINDYVSQYGLQGYIFSFMYNKLHIPFYVMKVLCCTALATVIVAICFFINKKYNKLLAGIFYITFLLSPWIVAFARNLYWVEFTWFLPMLFGLILSIYRNKKKVLIPCIVASVFIKCLCGYEYITTIMLATIAFLVIDFFTSKDKETRKEIFKTIIITGISCLLAFVMALCIHAILRGEGNILEGIKSVYKNDVLRRTIIVSNTQEFPEVYKESLDASVIKTIAKYFSWHTDIILGLSGKYFRLMILITISIIIHNILNKNKNCYQELSMFVIFLITTISWYVLGKSHSYIHTTMNYVLWYFGFIQICIYVTLKFIVKVIYRLSHKKELS